MKILGIETSCDDTSIAVLDSKNGLIAHYIYRQKIHKNYNGIIPEIAARKHLNTLASMIKSVTCNKLISKKIQGIAYTAGPGLLNSLLIGSSFSKAFAYSLNIKSIPINHIEAHLLSPMMTTSKIKFPFIGLLISGAHTQLILAKKLGKYKILGTSLDDAVGETFDKIANLLGIKYPGGAKLSKLAMLGKKNFYQFPKPMIKSKNLNFSFSGLKTYVSKIIKNSDFTNQTKYNIAKEFENTIINILIKKSYQALSQKKIKQILVSGGVSSNITLRKKFSNFFNKKNIAVFYPNLKFCCDNAAMIAYLGLINFFKFQKNTLDIQVFPKLSIEKKLLV